MRRCSWTGRRRPTSRSALRLQGHQRHPRPAGARVPRRRGVLLRHPGARRDSVLASGGPEYRVPLGRRDSPQFATQQDVLSGLPAPTSTVPSLLNVVGSLGLDATDLVALSGGRTAPPSRAASSRARPDHELGLPRQAEADVPTDRRTPLDVRTPDVFDNKYCVNLVNREGLFVSDQDLFTNANTRPIASSSASPAASGTSSTSSACPW
ncbi:hypothetical protein ZWY2020_026385 [Hordeum vulgare]|nr:hypothetical protein ZWY2020_026385 [Hordeum vulgare]